MVKNELYLPKNDKYKASEEAQNTFANLYWQMRYSCDLMGLRRFITGFPTNGNGSGIKFLLDTVFSEDDQKWLHKQLLRLGLLNGLIILSEYNNLLNGKQIEKIDWQHKYCTYTELLAYCRQLEEQQIKFGLTHGAFDPPHLDHAINFTDIYRQGVQVIVGFDPDWWLVQRKGSDRPRMPLAGRSYPGSIFTDS